MQGGSIYVSDKTNFTNYNLFSSAGLKDHYFDETEPIAQVLGREEVEPTINHAEATPQVSILEQAALQFPTSLKADSFGVVNRIVEVGTTIS